MICRLCHQEGSKEFFVNDNCPIDISTFTNQTKKITVYQCPHCDFIFLNEPMSDTYYDDYAMDVNFSQSQKDLQAFEFNTISNVTHIDGYCDIGCGEGSFLDICKRNGKKTFGIEPSLKYADRLAELQHESLIEYFDNDTAAILDTHIDLNIDTVWAFTAREVLEHVFDLHKFVNNLKSLCLHKDNVVAIEVPNIRKTIEYCRFYDFFPDHVNYFTEDTLKTLFAMYGFETLYINTVFNGEYIFGVFRLLLDVETAPVYQESLIFNLPNSIKKINSFILKSETPVIWYGVGAKGLTLLANINCDELYIIDDDPRKHGKKVYNTNKKVMNFEDLKINIPSKQGNVIISALCYEDVIRQKITKDFPDMKIYTIETLPSIL